MSDTTAPPSMVRLVLFVFLAACTKPAPQEPVSAEELLVKKGASSFQTNCIACHNPDPKKDGPLGPAVFGSSKELIEMRVLQAAYPPGYKPKRTSKVMVALPQLKGDLEALVAFLNKN